MIGKLLAILVIPFTVSAQTPETFLGDLEKVKAASFSLKNEQEKLRSLQSTLVSKYMSWTPSLSAGVGYVNNPAVSATATDYWKAEASLNLWNGGSDYHALKSADLNVDAQKLNQLNQGLKIEAQAADLIFKTLYSQDVVRSTRELVKLREESHRIVSEKYKQGKLPLQEVSKSEIDKSQQETRLRTLEAENLELQGQWKALIKEAVKTEQWPFETELKLPNAPLEFSPNLQRLEKLAKAAAESHSSQKGKHLASLDLTASLQEFPLQTRATRQWGTGVLFTVPLWSRYETQAAIASAYSSAVTAQSEFEQARLSELSQREVLQKRVDLYRKNLEAAKKNLEKAKGLYNDMVKSFRYGRMSVNDLLLEQNRLIESELSVSQSQLSFHKIVMETCALAGRELKSCLK